MTYINDKPNAGVNGLSAKDLRAEEVTGDRPESKVPTRWPIRKLFETDFPQPQWATPGLIPVGLSFLAGRPKVGKSWLALQLAGAVGSGETFLGRKVKQGRVLYLALEDSARRFKARAKDQGFYPDAIVEMVTEWRHLDDGGIDDLEEELHGQAVSLLIIDTLSKVLLRADQNEGTEMTALLGRLQRLAHDRNLAILLIDHHRKPARGSFADPITDILGSTAKAAVADVLLGLYRNKEGRIILKANGRDIEEQDLELEWNAERHCWHCLGQVDAVRADSFNGRVLTAIRELTELGEVVTNKLLTDHLDSHKGNVAKALNALVADGRVVKLAKQGQLQPFAIAEED